MSAMAFPIAAAMLLAHQNPAAPNVLLNVNPPRPRFVLEAPLPAIPGVMIDSQQNGWGYAQQAARAKGLQARVIWIDATANIDRYNDESKIKNLVARIADTGFNTIGLDVKPISGQVIYPSKIAPKLTEWKGRVLPAGFDPLTIFCREAKARGLSLLVSLNAFSEGHRDFRVGPGYDLPDQQTVLYEATPILRLDNVTFPIAAEANKLGEGEQSLFAYTDANRLPTPTEGLFAITLDRTGRIVDGFEFGGVGAGVPTIPRGGSALFGRGAAAVFLRQHAQPGATAKIDTQPVFVPISARPENQIPLMMNPHHPEVQKRALAILKELVSAYPVDGILYDDRLRMAGPDADFSTVTRQAFEKWLRKKVSWPEDVFQVTYTPNFTRGLRPGPYYEAWLTWRALSIRNFVARARQTVKTTRESTLFGVYAGSWYGEYPNLGSNYAASSYEAGFWFQTPAYQQTGFAGLLDLLITGCYYPTATIFEAMEKGVPIGVTVEAAGSMTNRLVRDRAWSYAGISLMQFKNDPDSLERALQAACAATQGVMVFDLSHDIDPMWPVFKRAFSTPAKPPHAFPNVLRDALKKRQAAELRGEKERPPIIVNGAPGAGQ